MSKVLFISYYFPPVGFAGVQRTVKFAKYLPNYGYEVAVVAGAGLKIDLPEDPTMMSETEHVAVHQVTLNRYERCLARLGRLKVARLLPLPSMGWWVRGATRKCEEVVIRERPDLLYVTVSPFPAARVGAYVSQKHSIPWVLDMRDPWALDPFYFYATWFHHRLQLQEMERMCGLADAVVMNTPNALDALINRFPRLDKDKLFYITNGWDQEDFQGKQPSSNKRNTPLTIAHTGSFCTGFAARVNSINRKMLSLGRTRMADYLRYSAAPSNILGRSPFYLFQAIRGMIDKDLIKPADIKLVFAGIAGVEDNWLIQKFRLQDIVEYKGYLNHSQSIDVLMDADVLFLPLHKPEHGQFPLIVPGKTYEYLAAQKPILALLPEGDAADFVAHSKLGYVCDPTDIEQIKQQLLTLLNLKKHDALDATPDTSFISSFERRKLTEKLAEVFQYALEGKGCDLTSTDAACKFRLIQPCNCEMLR